MMYSNDLNVLIQTNHYFIQLELFKQKIMNNSTADFLELGIQHEKYFEKNKNKPKKGKMSLLNSYV